MIYPIRRPHDRGPRGGRDSLERLIPTFAQLFAASAPSCRFPRASSSGFSNKFILLMPALIVGSIVFAFVFRQYYATHNGRRVVDRMLLRLPILGIILRKVAVARFCRTLSTLISSGVPILDGLTITAKTAGNAVIEDAIMTRGPASSGARRCRPAAEHEGVPADGDAR